MKNFLILLMVFVSLSIAKEIKIDKIHKSVKISNETILYKDAKTFCTVYNDTAQKQFRCYIQGVRGPHRIEIIEYDCPHILPAPLAQYFKNDSIRNLDFDRWAEICAEIQNFDIHHLDGRRIEFIKRRNKVNQITFTEIKEGI